METEDKKSYDLYVMIFNKNLTTMEDTTAVIEERVSDREFQERQFMDYEIDQPRTLEDIINGRKY